MSTRPIFRPTSQTPRLLPSLLSTRSNRLGTFDVALLLTLGLAGCSAGPQTPPPMATPDGAAPSTTPDARPPTTADVPPAVDMAPAVDTGAMAEARPPIDAGADSMPMLDAGTSDSSMPVPDAAGTTRPDAPKAWPPPGPDYLTSLATYADYQRMSEQHRTKSASFIIRRKGNSDTYPYPWDMHECIFMPENEHIDFLTKMDPARAVQIYFSDAKSANGPLMVGRVVVESTRAPFSAEVYVQNYGGVMNVTNYIPLDAMTGQQIRDRIKRCVPFATSFIYFSFCAGAPYCPLP
ncbi:MAG TPA: hypothetical protein VGF45_05090 [Polyangia bacterium]